MKFSFFSIYFTAFILIFSACGNRNNELQPSVRDIHNPASPEGVSQKEDENMPILAFEKKIYDFGKVVQGERLSYTFKFQNKGKANLIITNTTASCGCTTSIPPKAPIRPGEKGELQVHFDSKGKMGKETFTIVVSANTYPVNTIIQVTADVIKP